MDPVVSQFLAIAGVLIGLVAAVWTLKRRQLLQVGGAVAAKAAEIQVISHRPLSGQHILYVVRVRGEMLLIATSPGSCSLVHRLDAPDSAQVQ